MIRSGPVVARILVVVCALAGCDRVFGLERDHGVGPRSVLHLDHIAPAETLTDFPLLVVLDDTRAARELMQPGAADLRFYDAAGDVIPHQIEQLGSPGGAPLVAWVRVPEIIGASTSIAVDYARPQMPPPASASVWSDSYVAVWHLGATLADATTNQHEGIAFGTTAVPGLIGEARQFDPVGQNAIQVPFSAGFQTRELTVSGWMFQRTRPALGFEGLLTHEVAATGANDLYVGTESDGVIAEIATGPPNVNLSRPAPPLHSWYQVTLVAAIGDPGVRLYIDGELVGSDVASHDVTLDTSPFYIGADCNGCTVTPDSDFMDGMIDEVRYEKTARTSAWIAVDHASALDQAISYGPVDPSP